MVQYAYLISTKQSNRIILQAAKMHVNCWVEPICSEGPALLGMCTTIEDANDKTITLSSEQIPSEFHLVPTQYYQLIFSVADERYLAISDLQNHRKKDDSEKTYLIFTRPNTLQVMQRRRYHRIKPSVAIPVYISWKDQEELGESYKSPAFGQIIELSTHGMSIKTAQSLDNHIFIGDTIYIRFNLHPHEPTYFTPATICHKQLDEFKSELTVGVQFILSDKNTDFLKRLAEAISKYDDIFTRGT